MTDDKKEWVTIKIPETVRDRARDLDYTYGEIMDNGCAAIEGDSPQEERPPFELTEADIERIREDMSGGVAAASKQSDSQLTFDDVVAACRKALNDELTEEALQ